MSSPCTPNVQGAGNLSERDSEALLQHLKNRAEIRSAATGQSMQDSLKDIAGEIKMNEEYNKKKYERDRLLNVQAKRNMKDFAKRFPTWGEGLSALLVGSNKLRELARRSVDYQAKFIHGKFFTKLVTSLDKDGILPDFSKSRPEFVQDVYREMGAMKPGQPAKQVTKNDKAFRTAQIIDGIYSEMVARQNRAGGGIQRMPGYILRQTHDMNAIRAMGKIGNTPESKQESFKNWADFTRPLLDYERTFQGTDPEKTLRNIHEGLYTGKHGPAHEETDTGYGGRFSNLGDKISKERVLHFKDADAAYKYNQAFGIKNFREALLSDIHTRARQIALLENLGPHFERNFEEVVQELGEDARKLDTPSKHEQSLKDWKLRADFNEITGKNEWSGNPTLSKLGGFLRVNAQLSKMGAVVLSKTVDAGAITSEMAHNGLGSLGTLGRGLANMIHQSPDAKAFARQLGVGIEAITGNALSRFHDHSSAFGWQHTAQKYFFQLSLLPRWNDALRSSVATTLANNLGEHSHLPFEQLPGQLKNILTQYGLHGDTWNTLRTTAYTHNDSKFITPDMLHQISDSAIGKLIEADGRKASPTNILRMRDQIETSLGTYFTDRADIAVPTPGAKERKWSTFDTKAGTPIGEAMRMIMQFKSFPITIMSKILGRDMYGNGADTVKQWLLNDHRGKFNMAMTIAMMTAAGYVSETLHDLTKGKGPLPLINDGKIDWHNVQKIMVRGGSLGLYGETTMGEFSGQYRSYLEYAAGPTLGQADRLFNMKGSVEEGNNV